MKTKSAIPLAIAGVIILLTCGIHFLTRRTTSDSQSGLAGLIDQMEWLTYDARVKLGAAYNGPEDVATNMATLFFTDDDFNSISGGTWSATLEPATNSFQAINLRFKWPWPCFIHGQIVRELAAQGVIATGFDILFPEEDEINPLTDIAVPEEETVITSDEFFTRSLKAAGNVFLASQDGLLPDELFRTSAYGVAAIDSRNDYGIVRRVSPFSFVPIWNPVIKRLEKPLGLVLRKADFSKPGKIVIPTKSSMEDPNPAPFEINLNPNGTLKLTKDGDPASADETEENLGPAIEPPQSRQRNWNLGLSLAAKALGIDLNRAEIHSDKIVLRGPGLVREIPLDHEGKMLIDWSIRFGELANGKTPVHYGNLEAVLMADMARQKLKATNVASPFAGRIVLIGSEATGNNVSDVGATPLEPYTFLVTKHLNIANSILTGRFVSIVPLWAELVVIALLGSFASYLTWKKRVLTASVAIAISAVAYIVVAVYLYLDQRLWLAMVNPLAGGLILPYLGIVSYRVMFEQREQRRVKGIFSKIVSPDVVQELLKSENLAWGGERKEISVLFADVRGFTEFTDTAQQFAEEYVKKHNLNPREAEELYNKQAADTLETVNRYLATIADMVKKHQGTLDKYIGDCVMAFWGAPLRNPQHALCCVRAAIEAQRAMATLNGERSAENERRKIENETRAAEGKEPLPFLPVLSLGTGINSGACIVGLMGSNATILNYTVFGREVNLASRLEGVSGRGRIIISQATFQDLQRDDPQMASKVVELEAVKPKGFREPVRIFEVPWKDASITTDHCSPTSAAPSEPAERTPTRQAESTPVAASTATPPAAA